MNSNHIEKAKIRYPHFRFECTSLDSLIFEERKTLIILDGVIHHLDDEQVINLLSKIALIGTHSVFCKDPVITKNQDFFSYFLMKNDCLVTILHEFIVKCLDIRIDSQY